MANVKISNLSTIWTSSAAEFTAIKMDVTDTASSGSSKLMDLLVGGVSKVSVRKDGVLTAAAFVGQHTGSTFGTASVSISSSVSQQSVTSSHSLTGISSSFSLQSNQSVTASHALNGISASYSSYSGQSNTSLSASQATWSTTASFALNAGGSGGTTLISGSSYNITSSWAISSSYAMNSSGGTTLTSGSSYNITSSWSNSSSYSAQSANAITSSYSLTAAASLSSGSSYNITASSAISASYALSSSYAVTASYAERYAPYWPSNVQITGSNLVPNDNQTVWYIVTTGSFTLIASALGSQPQYYKWYINSSSLIQSGSSNSLLITGANKLSHSGYYTCQVTNSYGSSTSANFQVQVLEPAIIQSEVIPSATPAVNSMVSFQISPIGDNLGTRWKKRSLSDPAVSDYVQNGVPSILNVGRDTTVLSIQAISPESEGTYFCEVSNSISYTTSSNMLIYVTAPRITTQPSDLDSNGLSTVVATGSAISYSWEYNGVAITQQSASTLNLSQAVDDGYFTATMMNQLYSLRCRVYNAVGYNVSNNIQVKPFKKAGVTLTGHAGTAQRATGPHIAINAGGQIIAPIGTTYTVFRNGYNVGSDITSLGESSPQLTLHNVQSTDAGEYVVSASFNGKHVTSDAVSLEIISNEQYHNAFPAVRYVFDDEAHTLIADYGMSLGGVFIGTSLAGSYLLSRGIRQSLSYTVYDRQDLSGYISCPGLVAFPTSSGYPTSTVNMTGRNISGSSSAGSTTIYYQYVWSYNHANCPTNSLGYIDPWPCLHPDTFANSGCNTEGYHYYGSTIYTATIISYGMLGITVHPSGSQTKATGSQVALRTVATCGAADVHYRWYRNGVRIPDSDSSIYTISSVGVQDSGSYYCIAGVKSTLSYRTMQSSASILHVV